MICVNDEQLLNMSFAIVGILPLINNVFIPLKTLFPIDVTEEGISICVNDEHLEKEQSPICFTEEGIVTCVNDEQPEKAQYPIEFTEGGIVICINDVQLLKVYLKIEFT